MGQFVMSFRGVIMHVTKREILPPNVQHRVVPANASSGFDKDVHDWGEVPAHHCFLEFSKSVLLALLEGGLELDGSGKHVSMHGWSVRLHNPAGRKADIRLNGDPRVPCLTDYLPDMTLKKGIGNEVVVPPWAASFVDIESGTVTTHQFKAGGIHTTWSAETEGDPVLQFTQTIDGKPQQPKLVQIPSTPPLAKLANNVPGSMVMHNGTNDGSDKEFDFVLHFLANRDGVPKRSQLKTLFPIDVTALHLQQGFSTTTSCSNSQYP